MSWLGASGPTEIETWPAIHADALKKPVPLPDGVPQKDVFRRLLCALKPGNCQACLSESLETLREAQGQRMNKSLVRKDFRKEAGVVHAVLHLPSEAVL